MKLSIFRMNARSTYRGVLDGNAVRRLQSRRDVLFRRDGDTIHQNRHRPTLSWLPSELRRYRAGCTNRFSSPPPHLADFIEGKTKRSPHVKFLPGTTRRDHLEEGIPLEHNDQQFSAGQRQPLTDATAVSERPYFSCGQKSRDHL